MLASANFARLRRSPAVGVHLVHPLLHLRRLGNLPAWVEGLTANISSYTFIRTYPNLYILYKDIYYI